MVRTFQLTKVLPGMSVRENLLLAAPDQPGERFFTALVPARWRGREAEVAARAEELLALVGLAPKADDEAGTLSGGQRKLLELARALMVDPAMVMLDEPMAGVNPALTQSLLGHITGIRDAGRTVLFVEHDMEVVHEISDWVVVMAEGRVIAEGPPAAVVADPAVIDAYLGTQPEGTS
jgi:branched-chain amino acid transport system ATP-binding protein